MLHTSKLKVKKGDTVRVMTGKDRGREGRVERVWPKEAVVLVPGINEYKRHVKPRGEGRPGEIMTLSRPISVSKIMVIDPKTKQPTRVGYRFDGDKKIRVSRKSGADL